MTKEELLDHLALEVLKVSPQSARDIELVMQIGGCDRPEENSPALKMFVTFAKLVAEHEREEVTKERDRMCEHCKWRNDENSTLDETNQSKVLGKS